MKPIKIKWRVEPEPVGRYRSFEHRYWPSATFEDGSHCCCIFCESDYKPCNAKTGNHKELSISMADYSETQWKNVKMKHKCKTLKDAKKFVAWLLSGSEKWIPRQYRSTTND
jgi:hypothetical protein